MTRDNPLARDTPVTGASPATGDTGRPPGTVLEHLRGAHRGAHRSARGDAAPILLATVSGIGSTNPGMIEWFARETPVTIITTKSIQVHPNRGNREPVITEPLPGSFGNAVGLKNPGVAVSVREYGELRRRLFAGTGPTPPFLNISIAGRDPDEFARLARELAPLADLLELNLSCPHAHGGYGSVIGCNPALVDECTRAAVASAGTTPVFAKLTPNVDSPGDLATIAARAVAAGAAGIVAINTAGPDQYRERETGAIILNNPAPAGSPGDQTLPGRGGRSGRWIREEALACIREIRAAVGPHVPLIGMGGIELPEHAREMRRAGADVVGVGSALALVHQAEWPAMLCAIALSGGDHPRGTSAPCTPFNRDGTPPRYRAEAGMTFQRRTVRERRELGGGLFELECTGTLPFSPGQTAFLWLPGVGEKPFSPALAGPATFLIRRRGAVTEALGQLKRGDSLFIRGPYGSGSGVIGEQQRAGTALILAAGSGAALVPALAECLAAGGAAVHVMMGLRDDTTTPPLEQAIAGHATVQVVWDQGITGRVLLVAEKSYCGGAAPRITSLWAIGPDPFMEAAVHLGVRLGLPRDQIQISLEEEMLCGTGLCGMCHRGGRLTCSHGTLVTAAGASRERKES